MTDMAHSSPEGLATNPEPAVSITAPRVSEGVILAEGGTSPAPVTVNKAQEPNVVGESATAQDDIKPIYEGTLRYAAAGNSLMALFGRKDRLTFYYGDEPVPTDKLAHLLRPGKSEMKETAAWASQTGKGLLFFVKHVDQKSNPKGAINLAEIDAPQEGGAHDIIFKLHGHQHELTADTKSIRDGWLLSLREKTQEAKSLKDEIYTSAGFKEQIEKLGKPAVVAAAIVKPDGSPKKSLDERAPRAESDLTQRPTKDRSQSRGKAKFLGLLSRKESDITKEQKNESRIDETKAAVDVPTPELPSEPLHSANPHVPEATSSLSQSPKLRDDSKKDNKNRAFKLIDTIRGTFNPTLEKKLEEPVGAPTASEPTPHPDTATTSPEAIATNAISEAPVHAPESAVHPTTIEPQSVGAVAIAPADKASELPSATNKDERRRSFFGNVQTQLRSRWDKNDKKVKDESITPTDETPKIEQATVPAIPTAVTPAPVTIASSFPLDTETSDAAATTTVATPLSSVTKESETKLKKENGFIGGVTRSLSKAFRGAKDGKEVKKDKTKIPEHPEEPEQEVQPTDNISFPEPLKLDPSEPAAGPVTSSASDSVGDVVPDAGNVRSSSPPAASPSVQITA